jgi:hypothetical protein
MVKAFLSYPHIDDRYNAVYQFREHLANELEIIAPGSSVFQDKSNIFAGSRFESSIEESISEADVLIILLAPAWLHATWCRKEYELFVAKEHNIGLEPRILPILWVRAGALGAFKEDPIAKSLSKVHHEDWSELRHGSWDSELLRARVAALAETAMNLARSNRR